MDGPLLQHPDSMEATVVNHLVNGLPAYTNGLRRLPDSLITIVAISLLHGFGVYWFTSDKSMKDFT